MRLRIQTCDSCEAGAAISSEGAAGATASVATGCGSIVAAGVSSVAAKVAGASAGVVCSGAAFSVRLATPSGGGLGGRIVWCFSTSRFEISCSICALNSFEARLNSLSALPIWRAISGNFLGPKTTRANKNRKIVSEKLMRFIILPEPEKRQSLRDNGLTIFHKNLWPQGFNQAPESSVLLCDPLWLSALVFGPDGNLIRAPRI